MATRCFSPGELVGKVCGAASEANPVEQRLRALARLWIAGQFGGKGDVFDGVERRHQVKGLEDKTKDLVAYGCQLILTPVGDICPINPHAAACRLVETRENTQ